MKVVSGVHRRLENRASSWVGFPAVDALYIIVAPNTMENANSPKGEVLPACFP